MAGQGKEYVLGIDLGGTNIKGAILDLKGNIIEKKQISTLAHSGPESIASRMAGLAKELQDITGINDNCIMGLGIGVPGQSDIKRGCVFNSGNLGWENVYIVDLIKKHIDLPVFIENDANAAALGEKWCGAGKDAQNFVAVTIGTGIGGGIIIDGRLYRGASSMAAEIGHMVIEIDGPQCSCGNKGCLEALTAAPSILRRAQKAVEQGEETLLSAIKNLSVKDVFKTASKGDAVALRIIDETAHYLGIGLGNLVNIFNPELIVVGGGVSAAGDILFKPLEKYTLANSLRVPGSVVRVVPALLGNDAGSIGAAAVALQELNIN